MKKILVIGDIIIDNYLIGSTERISPEAPGKTRPPKATTFSR